MPSSAEEDQFLWLEDIEGENSFEWVETENRKTVSRYTQTEAFKDLNSKIKQALDQKDRIAYISKLGEHYYNFWQDEKNPKGVLRRTTLEEYQKEQTAWEIVLDIDQLAEQEGENWVYKGSQSLRPTFDRTFIFLSRGGGDAVVVREFDLKKLRFIPDGFNLTEAKSNVDWINRDEILVATNYGEGTLTNSGYPRIVKRWRRGTPLQEAPVLLEGATEDVATFGFSYQIKGFERHGVERAIDFYNTLMFIAHGDELVELAKPTDASAWFFRDFLLIEPKTEWEINGATYPSGSLLVTDINDFLSGEFEIDVLFEPTPSRSLVGTTGTQNYLILNILDNVRNRLVALSYRDGKWLSNPMGSDENLQTVYASAVDADSSDDLFIRRNDFITPPSFYLGKVNGDEQLLKQEAPTFDSSDLTISQHWATSKDGTEIPYFQVSRPIEGPQPTLLYGYGGFEVSMVPQYQKTTGLGWLESGGVYVVANIRGGGEFGPGWHQAALKANRHRAFEDFIAVSEDLIEREVTTPELLGAMGGSNGGLLMGNMLTMRPDLFGAIVAAVPLFDMKRYHLLLAGANWKAEYGDPDDADEWEFIKTFSPYHNLDSNKTYPLILVTSSTTDDRVHPGHGRKFVAKMHQLGHQAVYYENTEGGHAGAADNSQRAFMNALEYRFLWETLTSRPTN